MAKKARRGKAAKSHRPRANGAVIEFPRGGGQPEASQPGLWIDEEDPGEAAELLMERAYEASTEREARELTRAALRVDPEHADALTFLSEFEPTATKRAAMLERAVAAARDRLGPARFEDRRGSFWLEIDTRPYMRARYQLAMARIDERRVLEGVRHFEALIELCPSDNLGVRFRLLPLYLLADNVEAARDVVAAFEGDGGAVMSWSRVLIFYLLRDFDRAEASLAEARRSNRHVEAMLLRAELPYEMHDAYSLGSLEEAENCLALLGPCWMAHPMATAWLRQGGRPGDSDYLGFIPPPPKRASKKASKKAARRKKKP